MGEPTKFQLRSYEIPSAGMDQATFVEAVQLSFENWAGVTAEEKKMAKFFSGTSEDGSTFKVFALLPLVTTQKVGVEWSGGSGEAMLSREVRMARGIMKVTMKEDIQLKQEESAPGAGAPLTIK